MFGLLAVAILADQTDPSSLLAWVQSGGLVGALVFSIVAFVKELIVPGARYRRVEEEKTELQEFLRDQTMPVLTRVGDLLVKLLEERDFEERRRRREEIER